MHSPRPLAYSVARSGLTYLHPHIPNPATIFVVLWYESPHIRDYLLTAAHLELGQDHGNVSLLVSSVHSADDASGKTKISGDACKDRDVSGASRDADG